MATTRATGQPAPVPLPLTPKAAREALEVFLADSRWCRETDLVVLAVHEALINADRHGGGVSQIHASVEGGALVIVVCDRGAGFEMPTGIGAPTTAADPFAENGRGVWLIRQIASDAETRRDGADFCLRMRFDPPEDGRR